jgi:hypothetical protein
MTFDAIALHVPTILLPGPAVDLKRWAVIACDQYTSDEEYWQKVASEVGEAPSTLNLIYPEVFLEEADSAGRIEAINSAMRRCLDDGTLQPQAPGFLLIDRQTEAVASRKGLIAALDLEAYDYNEGAASLIRATEGTILDRLPPRVRVRRHAAIELPHIMVLIDDPQQTVIEPLFATAGDPTYDTELMLGGGHLRGWHIGTSKLVNQVASALQRLADPKTFSKRYDVDDKPVVLYAMGDGNHSFATAKAVWEELKANAADKTAIMDHPARYALVELVNVHDPGLEFEAIHRVLFDVEPDALLDALQADSTAAGSPLRVIRCADQVELAARSTMESGAERHLIPFVDAKSCGLLVVEQPAFHLAVATLQHLLDTYLARQRGPRIDYIHGEETVTRLGSAPRRIGFYLPSISKHDLFKTIILDGALPRKTFSMGEADEKRFYLECRRIVR